MRGPSQLPVCLPAYALVATWTSANHQFTQVEFTEAFEQLCTQYPLKTDIFAAVLSTTSRSDKISQFQIPGSDDFTDEDLFQPTNILISGVAIQANLCNSDAQLAESPTTDAAFSTTYRNEITM